VLRREPGGSASAAGLQGKDKLEPPASSRPLDSGLGKYNTGSSRNKENNEMRYLKMLGFAAVAAMALTAVLGAGSASAATFLCKNSTSPCTEHYPSGTAISMSLATGTTARFTTNLGSVTCKKSTLGGKTTSTEAHLEITSFTFTECTDPFGSPCTVKAVNLSYTANLTTATPGVVTGNGIMTFTPKAGAGNPGATVECGSFMNCKFTNSLIVLDVIGGAPATILANKESLNREGGICPSESFWDATYIVTAPNPLYVY
jgi:hypothetical protein